MRYVVKQRAAATAAQLLRPIDMPTDPNPSAPAENAPLADEQYARLAAFRQALRSYLRFSELAAERLGLTSQHYQALLVVRAARPAEPLTISALAQQLLIKHNSAVGLVDRLAAQGLLLRRPSREDRRKVELRLSAKGLRVLDRLADTHRDELERSGPQLSELLQQITRAARRRG